MDLAQPAARTARSGRQDAAHGGSGRRRRIERTHLVGLGQRPRLLLEWKAGCLGRICWR